MFRLPAYIDRIPANMANTFHPFHLLGRQLYMVLSILVLRLSKKTIARHR